MKNYYNQSTFLIVISLVILSLFSSCKSEGRDSDSKFSKNAGNAFSLGGHGSNTSSTNNLYAGNLSNYKSKANSSASNTATGLDMPSVSAPSAKIVETDVQNTAQSNVSMSGNNTRNQSQSNGFKSSSANSGSNQGSALVADINSTIKERTVTTGSVKSNVKSSSKSSAAAKAGAQKVGEKPGEPGYVGPSLPIGDGIWILLSFVCVYSGRKLFFSIV